MADGSALIRLPEAETGDPGAIVVLFAGGGGSSIAIEAALGRHPDAALNHWDIALGVHQRNYPDAEHYLAGALETDCRIVLPGRRIGLLWLSPDCRHFSPAKGSAIVSARIRALAWAAIPWIKQRRPDVVILENVEAFLTWGPTVVDEDGKERPDPARKGETFERWKRRFIQCGYSFETRVEAVADHGGRTIRKRLKIVARRDGRPIVWPEPTHAVRGMAEKRGLRPHRPAAEIIDFSRPCPSIFMSQDEANALGLKIKRPLEEATLRRIAKGLRRYTIESADPFIVPVTHSRDDRAHDVREPLRTITGANRGEFALIAARLEEMNSRSGGRALDGSAPAFSAHAHHGLVAAFLEQANTGMVGHDVRESLSTIVQKGCTQRLIAAQLTHFRGSNTGGGEGDLRQALRASTAGGSHQALLAAELQRDQPMAVPFADRDQELRAFLIKYYGAASAVDLADPLATTTSRARFGLVMVAGVAFRITDIGMRMLDPETELAAAMGVPRRYVLGWTADGRRVSKTNITKLVGNMVAREWAERIVAHNCAHLAAPGFVYREAA